MKPFTWQEEIAVLRFARGALYRSRRDALLEDPPAHLRDSLEQLSTAADAAQATTASILAGWMDHAPLYRSVLAELDAVDVEAVSASQVGFNKTWSLFAMRAEEEWGKPILPLCWEQITRFVETEETWRTIAFLRMLRALPDARSLMPVVAGLESATDYGLADVHAGVLRALPRESVGALAADLFRRHDQWSGLYQRIVREGGQ